MISLPTATASAHLSKRRFSFEIKRLCSVVIAPFMKDISRLVLHFQAIKSRFGQTCLNKW